MPIGQRLHQLAHLLPCEDQTTFFKHMKSFGGFEFSLIKNNNSNDFFVKPGIGNNMDFYHSMMLSDSVDYLPDDILVKVDRSAMSVGLESCVPLLDHRIVEFAWQLPVKSIVRDGKGKWPLQQVLKRYVPNDLVDRPKMGFNLPVAEWIRGPLRSWAEDLLSEDRLLGEGYFDTSTVQNMLKEHMSGQRDWYVLIWRIIAFQSWLEKTRP